MDGQWSINEMLKQFSRSKRCDLTVMAARCPEKSADQCDACRAEVCGSHIHTAGLTVLCSDCWVVTQHG